MFQKYSNLQKTEPLKQISGLYTDNYSCLFIELYIGKQVFDLFEFNYYYYQTSTHLNLYRYSTLENKEILDCWSGRSVNY